jgi:hypothetical protein
MRCAHKADGIRDEGWERWEAKGQRTEVGGQRARRQGTGDADGKRHEADGRRTEIGTKSGDLKSCGGREPGAWSRESGTGTTCRWVAAATKI